MKYLPNLFALAIISCLVSTAYAQVPPASEHHKVLKMEEGKWKATTKLYMGPAGMMDEPAVSSGVEVCTMLGEFWVVSDFDGDFGGMPFKGHGTFGYDAKKGKYVGTWIDSFNPNSTEMVGTFDAEAKTMTYQTVGVGMDGNPSKGKNVIVYKSENERHMDMYMTMPGADEMVKVMEISYTRMKDE